MRKISETRKKKLDLQISVKWAKQCYRYNEFQILSWTPASCKILMFTRLMTSKLIYLLMDCETVNYFAVLEQVRSVFPLQTWLAKLI